MKEQDILIKTDYPELSAVFMSIQAMAIKAFEQKLSLNELSIDQEAKKATIKNAQELNFNLSIKFIKDK
jgi:hypothetical protein